MKSGSLPSPASETTVAEAARAARFVRKQEWKEKPGNRYTPEELRLMSKNIGAVEIIEPDVFIMDLD